MQFGSTYNNINPIVLKFFFDISPNELLMVNSQIKDHTESEIIQFCTVYRSKRRDPQLILILCILGFFGVAGMHRFIVGQIGMGILYFFTGGLCLVGTILDALNYQSIALEYNTKMVVETKGILNMFR